MTKAGERLLKAAHELRGTGRTLKMVQDLPQGEIIIITPHQNFTPYLRDMIIDIHGAERLTGIKMIPIEAIENYMDMIRGYNFPICVDHSVYERQDLGVKFIVLLRELAYKSKVRQS